MNESEKTDFEILRSYSFDRHIEILNETIAKTGDRIHDWSETQTLWISLYKAMNETEDGDFLLSHVTFHRFNELLRNLRWCMTSVFSGAYDSAMRELRFILEDICQGVHLDSLFRHLPVGERYHKLGDGHRLRGRALIERLPISKEIQKQLKNLYKELSDYTHPSFELLDQSGEDPKVVFFFKEDWFNDSQLFHRRVSDAVFFLIIQMFSKAGIAFLQKQNIVPALEKMEFTLTLSTSVY